MNLQQQHQKNNNIKIHQYSNSGRPQVKCSVLPSGGRAANRANAPHSPTNSPTAHAGALEGARGWTLAGLRP